MSPAEVGCRVEEGQKKLREVVRRPPLLNPV